MDAIHSNTSVFYQAMPAVGADGKNIMKLIPVKRVNGQFYQTETLQRSVTVYNHISPVHTAHKSAVTPPNNHQFNRNASSNQIHPAHRDSEGPPRQQGVTLTARVPQTAFPPPGPPCQPPVTVKSPAIPRGQVLKSPPDAQVQRVPASTLSPVTKDQVFTSSSSSASPTVVYVSPVNPASPKRPSNTKAGGSPPTGAKPQLKLVPEFSDRPQSPIRWMIEGAEGPPLLTSQNRSRRPTENALVVFDGRVFFVANKNGSSLKSPTAGQTADPPAPPAGRNRRGPSDPQDVIDLCGDDDDDNAQKDPPPQAQSPQALPSRQDEDNVIFVSYIPPKPDVTRMVPPQGPARGSVVHRQTGLGGPGGVHLEPISGEESQKSELAAPEPGQRSDPQLRKLFGITAEVKVYLQQVDAAAAAGCVSEDKTPSPQDHCGADGPPGLSEPNPEPPSALESCRSGPGRSPESQAAIGYMEPIDEDISEESEARSKPRTKPVPLETRVDPDTRRVGRTRKRTLCPCCVPVALHPAVKSGLRLEELEGWMLVSEQTARRVGRTKTSRKDGRKIRYKNCKIHKEPGDHGLSSAAVDSLKTSSG